MAGIFDAVDDCGNLDPFGPFSRVWQNFTNPTFGPFDPERPQQTLLSNGTLDLGDAPMPAARVDWAIARNSGGPSTTWYRTSAAASARNTVLGA